MEKDSKINERNYIAFISYRHKPLDIAVAKKLHRRIERYVIPKELRGYAASTSAEQDAAAEAGAAAHGQPQDKPADRKKLGLVFRDQDELPIANNLTENIRTALDHAKFLIVVCSPETPGSEWVQREISYFLEHHDRDHLLAVLIDGDPDRSFPRQLTEVRDEEGHLIERIEPLAANIVADTPHKRNRLFRTESLRILASLIGCPYDALYHREQRYRMRRFGIAAAGAALVAAVFIGMLLNRNAVIREQLLTSMINESRALAALSESAFRDGDYRGALEYALDALPGRNPGRPYLAEAESALSDELNLYHKDLAMDYVQSFTQDTAITAIALSKDGSRMATGDAYGKVRCFDINSGELLWNAGTPGSVKDLYYTGGMLLADNIGDTDSIFTADGELVRQTENEEIAAVDEEKGEYLSFAYSPGLPLRITDVKTGEILFEPGAFDNDYYRLEEGAISPDGRYCAVLAKYPGDEQGADLYVFDMETGARKQLRSGLYYASALATYNMIFDDSGNLILVFCGLDRLPADRGEWKGNYISLFSCDADWEERFTTDLDFGTAERRTYTGLDISDYLDYLGCVKDGIAVAGRNRMIVVETATGQIRWQKDLPERVRAAKVYPNGEMMGLILGNGLITMCTTSSGALSSDYFQAYHNCQFDLYGGVISGDSLNGGRYAVIPDRSKNRVSVISARKNKYLADLPWSDKIPEKIHPIYSPSKTAMAAVSYDETAGCRAFYVDLVEGSVKKEIPISDDVYNCFTNDCSRAALSDTGKLILGGKIFNFQSDAGNGSGAGAGSFLTVNGEQRERGVERMSATCTDMKDAKLITASIEQDPFNDSYSVLLWENGAFAQKTSAVPAETASGADSRCRCRAVNAGGSAVVCGQKQYGDDWKYAFYNADKDKWTTMDYMSTEEEQVMALASGRLWIAVQKDDGSLCVRDLDTGEEIVSMENTLPGEGVTRLLFAGDDEWLMAFAETGALAIFSTKDGKELHHSTYDNYNMHFHSNARYETHYIPQDNRILIVTDDYSYTEPIAILIDAASMKRSGIINAVTCYFPSANTVFIKHDGEGMRTGELFNVESLQEKAEELLKNLSDM